METLYTLWPEWQIIGLWNVCYLCVQQKGLVFPKTCFGEKEFELLVRRTWQKFKWTKSCLKVWTFYSFPIKPPALSWCPSCSIHPPQPMQYRRHEARLCGSSTAHSSENLVRTHDKISLFFSAFSHLSLNFFLNSMMTWIDKEEFQVKSGII